MIKIAIVEDEKEWCDTISKYIVDYGAETSRRFAVDVYRDGLDFVSDFEEKGGYDLIFMDIAMPYMNGLEASHRLRKVDENVCLIFITTMAQCAVNGYEVNALDFLIKPVEYGLFKIKLDKAIAKIERAGKPMFTVVIQGGVRRVPVEDIKYIESVKHYLYFHTRGEMLKMRGSLDDIKQFFSAYAFADINRSLTVNLAYVDGYSGGEVKLDGEVLPLSRIYKSEFLEKLAAFLGGTR